MALYVEQALQNINFRSDKRLKHYGCKNKTTKFISLVIHFEACLFRTFIFYFMSFMHICTQLLLLGSALRENDQQMSLQACM